MLGLREGLSESWLCFVVYFGFIMLFFGLFAWGWGFRLLFDLVYVFELLIMNILNLLCQKADSY